MATSNQNPLSDFTSLGPSILFYLPPSTTSHDPNITTPPPSLIILATWNSALPKHIAKYTTNYRTIYPSSPILIIRNTIADLVIRSYSSQEQRLIAALPVLQEYGTGKILLHLFSNGGASMATQLARTYKIEMGRPLSVGALVLDSSPGEATFKRTANATIATLPKGILFNNPLVQLLVYILLGIYFVVDLIFSQENVITRARNDINDKSLITGKERLYLYSVNDPMVGWKDVEAHSHKAEKHGWVVRREKWDTSGHCSHMYADPKRYWDAVQNVWAAGSR